MANANFGDGARDSLRALVAATDREIARLPVENDAATGLRASWTELVRALALGPAPETRACPACKGIGMAAASRCGHCWADLAPLPKADQETRRDS